jgi:hypothetical protein
MTGPDLRTQILLRSEESSGQVSVMYNVVAPRAKGPPLHKHEAHGRAFVRPAQRAAHLDQPHR